MLTPTILPTPGLNSWAAAYVFVGAYVNSHIKLHHPSFLLRLADLLIWPLKLVVLILVYAFFFLRRFPKVFRQVRSRR